MMTIFVKKCLQAVVQLFGKHSTAALRVLIRGLIVPDEEYIMPWSHTRPGVRCQGIALLAKEKGAICEREGYNSERSLSD